MSKRPRKTIPRPAPPQPGEPSLPLLYAWRKAKGLSQEKLAAELGATQGLVSQWEAGDTDVPMRRVKDIAKALGITVRQLMFQRPHAGEDLFDVVENLPESEHARAIAVLKALRSTTP